MLKKVLSTALSLLLLITSSAYAETTTLPIDELKGLQRNPQADRIDNGAHAQFDNVYISDGNIQVVKGRDRLNSTALSNVTTNGFWYYENAAGTTKKLVRMENTALASYDVDGTNRTSLNTGLTNEPHDAVQIGDSLYITSTTDGLYVWTGSGAASAVTGVSAPSTVDFSATTGTGSMTPGIDILVTPSVTFDDSCAIPTTATAATGCTTLTSFDLGGSGVTTDDGTLEQAGTTTTYSYKVSSASTIWNIETEPSSADTATLKGDDTFTWAATSCNTCDQDCGSGGANCNNGAGLASCCTGIEYITTGKQTRTTGTLASAPSDPFNGYCIYRTVAGGTDYFKVGCVIGGGTAYTDGKADAALADPLDTTIDTIDPPSYRYTAEYKGVLFLAEGKEINYTHLPIGTVTSADKYWLKDDRLDTGGKKPITGLQPTANSLLVFSSDTVQEVTGFGAGSFRLKTLLQGVGAISDETIEADSNGDIIFFSGVNGVYKIRPSLQAQDDLTGTVIDQPKTHLVRISSPFMDDVFAGQDDQIDLDPADFSASHAYYDFDNDLYFLYIGSHCFIFDNANAQWSHVPAARMGASVYRKSPSAAGQGVLVDNVGFMYNNWTGYENGIHSGSVTGTITASGNTTLTCGACSFNTTNDGLKGLWVFLDNENGEYRQIASNTGTQLTVSTAWTTNPIAADSFYVGYIIPHVKTKQYSLDKPPKRTSQAVLWFLNNKADSAQTLEVYGYQDKSTLSINATNAKEVALADRFITPLGFPMNSPWVQWEYRTFIYNTSDSINPPLDITAYAISGEVLPENSR